MVSGKTALKIDRSFLNQNKDLHPVFKSFRRGDIIHTDTDLGNAIGSPRIPCVFAGASIYFYLVSIPIDCFLSILMVILKFSMDR